MRTALPVILILLAVAAGIWILASSEEEPAPGAIGEIGGTPADEDPDMLHAGGLKGSGEAPKGPERHVRRPIDPRTVPRGKIDVLPVGPDLAPVPNRHLKVYVEALGLKDWRKQLGHYDEETGVWSFDKILAGDVEVRVFGDHVIEAKQRAKVRKGQRTSVQVQVKLAGAISYHAKLRDGTEPEDVTLTLFDMDDKPVAGYHESRSARRISTPRKTTTSVQGPKGIVFGIPAGRYRLRVDSKEHGYRDVVADVELARTHAVELELGR